MKIQYNDKTYFSTTLVKYCEYLSEILSLYKYSNSEYCSINIKNNKLIQEYKLEKRTYYNMIEILKELKIISETVINNLTGVYHKRVEYPDVDFGKKKEE